MQNDLELNLPLVFDYAITRETDKAKIAAIVTPACNLCQRMASRKNIIMGEGSYEPTMMWIGPQPEETDDMFGRPYLGDRGVLLNRILKKAEMDRRDVYVTYMVKCFGGPKCKKPKVKESKACFEYLQKEIRSVAPKLVILEGPDVLKMFLGDRKANLTLLQGGLINLEQYPGIVFMPVVNIDSIFVDSNHETQIVRNIKRGHKAAVHGVAPKIPTDYVFLETEEKLDTFIEMTKNYPILSLDIETDGGKDFMHTKTVCWAVSWAPGKAAYFPWLADGNAPYWPEERRKPLLDKWNKYLENKKLILHNGKYDLKILRYELGITSGLYYLDTLISSNILDETQMSKKLKNLAWSYTDMGGYDDALEKVKVQLKVNHDYSVIPRSILKQYVCFESDTRVTLADGSRMAIGKIVNGKLPVVVKSYNSKTGLIENKRVVNWFKNGQKVEEFKKDNTKPNWFKYKAWHKLVTGYKSQGITYVSPSHKYFTPAGWRKVEDLRAGDKIYVQETELNWEQKQLIRGCLLGDGHLRTDKDTIALNFTVSHSAAQKEYSEFCQEVMSTFGVRPMQSYAPKNRGEEAHTRVYEVNSRSSAFQFSDINPYVIRQGKRVKVVTLNYLNQLNDMGLAFWYMDDGCLHKSTNKNSPIDGSITLATYAFDQASIRNMRTWFKAKYGVAAVAHRCRMASGRYGTILTFNRADSHLLFTHMAKYIIPCLQYKLPEAYRGRFTKSVFMRPCAPITELSIKSNHRMSDAEIRAKGTNHKNVYYNIEVEGNHNYFANNNLVSNCGDVDCTFRIYLTQLPMIKAQNLEFLLYGLYMPVNNIFMNLEYNGVYADREHLKRTQAKFEEKLAALTSQIHAAVGRPFDIAANEQLAEILFKHLNLPVIRLTDTMESTDKDTLKKLKGKHPVVELLLEYRALATLLNTFVIPLLRLSEADSRVHTDYKVGVQNTSRTASARPNLQNLPRENKDIKKAFTARPGYIYYEFDFSQIEIRVLAHLSQDKKLIDDLNSGLDIHRVMASTVYGIAPEKVTKEQRSNSKSVSFGIIYGMSWKTLAEDKGMSKADAKRLYDNFFRGYPGVAKWIEDVKAYALQFKCVYTPLGRIRHLDGIDHPINSIAASCARCAVNSPIQSHGADITNLALINLIETYPPDVNDYTFCFQIHDAVVLEMSEKNHLELWPKIKILLETTEPLCVPTPVGIKRGPSLGEMEEIA